jgi:hypothetical protein
MKFPSVKLTFKLFTATALSILVSGSLTGCSLGKSALDCGFPTIEKPSGVTTEIAAIVAPGDNFMDLESVIKSAASDIKATLTKDRTQFTVVLADGDPSQVTKRWVAFEDGDFEVDRQNTIDRTYKSLVTVSRCLEQEAGSSSSTSEFATQTDVDLLKAMQIAADSFEESASDKELFVLANGIQTAGQYLMQNGLAQGEDGIASAVAKLKQANALPDLGGATVHWFGLGVVDGAKQAPLNQQSVEAIEAFWTSVIASSNGKMGKTVRSIPFKAPGAGAISTMAISGLANACLFTLTEKDGFNFQPDSAEFLDRDSAIAGAEELARKISSAKCVGSLTVTGYAASGVAKDLFQKNTGKIEALSLARATAFMKLLQNAGVNQKITVVGGGKGPVNDWNPDGSFSEDLGKLNRKVVVSQ